MTEYHKFTPYQVLTNNIKGNQFGRSLAMNDKFLAIRTTDKSSIDNSELVCVYAESTNLSFDPLKNSYIEINRNSELFFSESDNWFIEMYFSPAKLGSKQSLFFNGNGIINSWANDFNFSINVNEYGCVEFLYSTGEEIPKTVKGSIKLLVSSWNKIYLYYQGNNKLLSIWINNNLDVSQSLYQFKPLGKNPKITIGRPDILIWDPEYAYYADGELTDIRFSKGGVSFELSLLINENLEINKYNILVKKLWKETQQLKFKYDNLIGNDFSNRPIEIDNDTILVATPKSTIGNTSNAGLIFAFNYNNPEWSQTQFINANSPRTDAYFGSALYVKDKKLLVGSPGYISRDGNVTGAVYEFAYENYLWTQNEIILHVNNDNIDRYIGKVVTATPDYTYVFCTGLPNDTYLNSSLVYIFKKNNFKWAQYQTISSDDIESINTFGQSIVACKNFAAISSPNHDPSNSGKVYLYKLVNDNWEIIQTITQSELQQENIFGFSICLSEDYLMISSIVRDGVGGSGIIYIYYNDNSEWKLSQTIIENNFPNLGIDMGITEDFFVAGSPSVTDGGNIVCLFSKNR